MKKILLFADIGGHEEENYYHVGDEAMFYETYRWYKTNHPRWKLTAASWTIAHSNLDIHETRHLSRPKINSKLLKKFYFPSLFIKFLLHLLTNINLFSPSEYQLIMSIKKQDRIHFTGGGNLSSQFRPWLYYSFFVLFVARSFSKQILLTSQTIGPISGIDKLLANFIFNFSDLITVRSKLDVHNKKSSNYFSYKIESMLDAAYNLPTKKNQPRIKHKNNYVIGLSIHSWKGYERKTIELIKNVLVEFSKNHSLSIVIIPHHLTLKNESIDSFILKEIIAELPSTVSIYEPNSQKIIRKISVPATEIKLLTSRVDLLLTTRYHGIIFALSQNIPTIAISFDKYYQEKNTSTLKMIYGSDYKKYHVTVQDKHAYTKILKNMTTIKKNGMKEKARLQKINAIVSLAIPTLDTVMKKFESNNKI